ncbi:uncharacterized protein LOC101891367 [Musca domestica]|uniref:Uncharacterized protein LOC101891367 n=1 Tax=Musca domestica TaxID=7370 RepID=A0ABM3VD18_MUSDO|nr:uncharacterized protein LOC101891367 [Musca domestica]
MLYTIGIFSTLIIQNYFQAMDKKELEEKVKKLGAECAKEVGISDDEMKLFIANQSKAIDERKFTDKMKCYMLCWYKKIGIFDADGKPKIAEIIKFFEERYHSKKDKVKPALNKCASIKEDNMCEHVFKFERCVAKAIEG